MHREKSVLFQYRLRNVQIKGTVHRTDSDNYYQLTFD